MIMGSRLEVALLVIIGGVIGLCAGLLLSWIVWPSPAQPTDPKTLRSEYLEDYIVLIAGQYAYDGDLTRARNRLAQLRLREPEQSVAQLTNRYITEGGSLSAIRALTGLSFALDVTTASMVVYVQTPTSMPTLTPTKTLKPTRTPTPMPTLTPTKTLTSTLTPTPIPTLTPTATSAREGRLTPTVSSAAPDRLQFLLTERRRICHEEAGAGVIQITVRNVEGRGLPNVQLILSSAEGQDLVYTGLKPERGMGHADLWLRERERVYALAIPGSSEVVRDLASDPQAAGCPTDSSSVSWQLTFVGKRR